jgi:hypothetical protein
MRKICRGDTAGDDPSSICGIRALTSPRLYDWAWGALALCGWGWAAPTAAPAWWWATSSSAWRWAASAWGYAAPAASAKALD